MYPDPTLIVLKKIRMILGSSKRHYRRVEAECGISGAALWALAEIAERPGMSVSDLANQLAIHQTTASNLLLRLEQAGMIERERAESDQRVVRLRPSQRGRQLLEAAPAPVRGVLQAALRELSKDTLAELDQALSRLVTQMEHVDREAASKPLAEL